METTTVGLWDLGFRVSGHALQMISLGPLPKTRFWERTKRLCHGNRNNSQGVGMNMHNDWNGSF